MRLSSVSRTSTVPNDKPGEVLLDDYVAELQAKEEFYFGQLATMKEQILAINQDYICKEDQLNAQLREAVTAKQVLEAELSILSDSQQRLLRSNAELEDRISNLTLQISELTGRCDFLEAERIQALTSLELPHPDFLKNIAETICEKEVAFAEREIAKADLEICNDKLECAVVLIENLKSQLREEKLKFSEFCETQEKMSKQILQDSEILKSDVVARNDEIKKLKQIIDDSKASQVTMEEREEELEDQLRRLRSEVEETQQAMKAQEDAVLSAINKGTAEASELVNSLRTEIAQLRIEQKSANERLQVALEDANRAEEKVAMLEGVLTVDQKSRMTPTKRVKVSDSVEVRKLQLEITALRLKVAEFQEKKENVNKRKCQPDDDQSKNRRVSLDQEECRQQ